MSAETVETRSQIPSWRKVGRYSRQLERILNGVDIVCAALRDGKRGEIIDSNGVVIAEGKMYAYKDEHPSLIVGTSVIFPQSVGGSLRASR